MLTFKHAGRMGDVLYSLYYATRYAQGQPFDYLLRTGVRAYDPSNRPHMMEREDALFMSPLLEYQPYLNSVQIAESDSELPFDCVVLDKFRSNMSSIIGKEIRTWYYERGRILEGEFARKVLSAPVLPERLDKFAVCFTPRYRQTFDISVLRKYQDQLVFVGLPDEWRSFSAIYFPVEYHPVKDALELLSFVQSCRGFIGNVSGTFAIMECAKVRRILCLAPDGGNVRVYGNGFEASNENELEAYINQIGGNKP